MTAIDVTSLTDEALNELAATRVMGWELEGDRWYLDGVNTRYFSGEQLGECLCIWFNPCESHDDAQMLVERALDANSDRYILKLYEILYGTQYWDRLHLEEAGDFMRLPPRQKTEAAVLAVMEGEG